MASRRRVDEPEPKRGRPATTPKAREDELVNDAYRLAKQQLRDGSASSQVITHFIKAGSQREELEQQRLHYENELTQQKMKHMKELSDQESIAADALRAMRSYQGHEPEPEDDDDY